MDKALRLLCDEVANSVKAIYKLPKETPRQIAVLETAMKIREARIKLAQAKRTKRGKALAEIEREENKLEKMNLNLARKILGIDLNVFTKVKA